MLYLLLREPNCVYRSLGRVTGLIRKLDFNDEVCENEREGNCNTLQMFDIDSC